MTPSARGAAGFTLVEVLIALALFTGGVGVVIAAMQLGSQTAVHASELADGERTLRAFAEHVVGEPYDAAGAYGGGFDAGDFTATVEQVACWDGSLAASPFGACGPDTGVQRILLRVDTPRTPLYVEVVKRDEP